MHGLVEACRDLPLVVKLMVPSCVPALPFEDEGAFIDAGQTQALLEHPEFFRSWRNDERARHPQWQPRGLQQGRGCPNLDKPVDGHAPLCTGADLEAYARAGIRTDHECTTTAELRERISLGMYVSIREGSLARNLLPLIENLTADLSRRCSFCTDDRHAADTIERGHINGMLAMAVKAGIRPVDALRMATLNTAECYGLQHRGVIAPGRRADLLLLDNLDDFSPLAVWTKGRLVARNGSLVIGAPKQKPGFLADTVRIAPVTAESFDFQARQGMPG